jgi:hypothetical protein
LAEANRAATTHLTQFVFARDRQKQNQLNSHRTVIWCGVTAPRLCASPYGQSEAQACGSKVFFNNYKLLIFKYSVKTSNI